MKNRLYTHLKNTSLKNKFMFMIVCILIFVLSIASIVSNKVIYTYNDMIQKQTAASIALTKEYIETNIDIVSDTVETIIFDSNVQTTLGNAHTSPTLSNLLEAISQIDSTVSNYYDKLSGYSVSYLMIVTDYAKTNNYVDRNKIISDEIVYELCDIASSSDGKGVLVTEYSDTEVFLTRSIRKFTSSGINELGTVIVCIDVEDIVKEANRYSNQYSELLYVLSEGDQIVFCSEELPEDVVERLNINSDGYSLQNIDGVEYFITSTYFTKYGFNCYSFLKYDQIANVLLKANNTMTIGIILIAIIALIASRAAINRQLVHIENLISKIKSRANPNEIIIIPDYDYENRHDEMGYLHQQYDLMLSRIENLVRESYEAQLLHKDAELQHLKAQINPHFLYNTLDSLNWRAKSLGDEDMSSMIESLAFVLRSSMKKTASSALKQEILTVEKYLSIQKYRFGDMLSCDIDIDESFYEYEFPTLTLQVFVENAIKYSIEALGEDCKIKIHAAFKDDDMVLVCENTGSSFPENLLEDLETRKVAPKGFGIGILNIHNRIKLMYGDAYGVSFDNDKDWAIAKITVPAKKFEEENLI